MLDHNVRLHMPIKMMNYLFIYLFEYTEEEKKTPSKRVLFMYVCRNFSPIGNTCTYSYSFRWAPCIRTREVFWISFLFFVLLFIFFFSSSIRLFFFISGIEKCFISNCRFFWCTFFQSYARAHTKSKKKERLPNLFFVQSSFTIEHLFSVEHQTRNRQQSKEREKKRTAVQN